MSSDPTAKIFRELALWIDAVARDGPAQMACDEALLGCAEVPVLRVFRWAQPWVSAGYFVPFADAQAARPDLPVCRRWTGGGVVVHDGDFTFSLVAPRGEPWAMMRPEESYRALHEALAAALRGAGRAADLAAARTPAGHECFAGPVRHDILSQGRKIAGGAQRRTKRGLLHQGSIQSAGLAADFGFTIACHLAESTGIWGPPDGMDGDIKRLAHGKYEREDFLRRA